MQVSRKWTRGEEEGMPFVILGHVVKPGIVDHLWKHFAKKFSHITLFNIHYNPAR